MKMKKWFALILSIVVVLSFVGCGNSAAKKNITGTWVVESYEHIGGSPKDLGVVSTRLITSIIFDKGREIKFLSNGTFTSGGFNLTYELVDDQFIYHYEDDTFAYDCEIKGDTMTLTAKDVTTVTLKKQ